MRGLLPPALAVVVVLLVGAAAAPATAADDGFHIAAPDALDVPNQTVTFRSTTYPVDGYLRTSAGANRTVEVTAPDDEEYYVTVYDNEQRATEHRSGNGSATFAFDFEGYEVGTYLIALRHDNDIKAVLPVVVRGYTVSHDAPETADVGDDVEVRVDVTRTVPNDAPNGVTVAVADGETTVRTTAHRQADGSYVANVSTADLDAGTYAVWALAECTVEAFGHTELEGMSEPTTMELAGSASSSGDASTETADASTPTGSPTSAAADADASTSEGSSGEAVTTEPPAPSGSSGPLNATIAVGLVLALTVGGLLWRRF